MMGMTRSLPTMMDSATESTMTMAVAADRPPRKASTVRTSAPADMGRSSTNISGCVAPPPKLIRPAAAMGTTNTLIAMR